ncbi:hypothetical protein P168DRAFT_329186 [Aspergillus campestris IBT 28561]|uniref:Uncharacterized protein n=1 Tax=Aspergillus campestris (strain IBT 28561) TaxID=1392248 RepID=A0A2I1CX73_ASPC2|nr:uncharacterized protein P168DRAFT_329186 [Aspergillus campestris IBT 28561]PKY02228.1 hypothetical protein P168DRAFT_329186 [Aspergillus campestris IBT 28561]
MADLPSKLPANPGEWHKAVKEHNLVGKTVHTAELASASKIEFRQFLLLRVLWNPRVGAHLFRLPPVLNKYHAQAKELLATSQSWADYCSGIKSGQNPEGIFSIARHYQIKAATGGENMRPDSFDTPVAKRTRSHATKNLAEALRGFQIDKTPSKTPIPVPQTPKIDSSSDDESDSRGPTPAILVPKDVQKLMYPPTKDEQIVNAALVIFLNALTIHFPIIERCEWTMHRQAFVSIFEEAESESRTDGYLDDGKENPYALIEVKPITRTLASQSRIQMQEGSQMAGWIKTDTNASLEKLRVHVSQDQHEIFITIAEYDSGYVSYLRKKPHNNEPPSFLTMCQYGPWITTHAGHMKKLGPILLALTLYAEGEVRKTEASLSD